MLNKFGKRSLALTAVAALGVLTACGGSAEDEAEAAAGSTDEWRVSMSTPTPLSLTWAPELRLMHEEGRGLDFNVYASNGSAQALQLVEAGRSDFTSVGPTDYLLAKEGGADLTVFGIRKGVNPFHFVTPEGEPINEASDLVGGSVGLYSVGGTTEHLLDMYLEMNGVDPDEVDRQAIGGGVASYENVKSGDIQTIMFNNGATTQIQETEDVEVLSLQDVLPMAGQMYVAQMSKVQEEPDKYQDILRELESATQDTIDEQSEDFVDTIAALEVAGVSGLDTAVRDLSVEMDNFGDPANMANQKELWDITYETLMEGDFLQGDLPPVEDLYFDFEE